MTEEKKLILIVDEEESVRSVIGDELRAAGFDTVEAEDGIEGLKMALDKKPDLILLDIMMPGEDGFAVLEKLRKDPWGKNAKVILLSNLSDMESTARAMENETYDFLVKTDWEVSDVVEKIKEKLSM